MTSPVALARHLHQAATSRLVAAAAIALIAGACKDKSGTAPPDPRGIRKVLVGAQVDPTALHASGEFVLRLVPLDGKGDVILSDGLDVTPKITAPVTQTLAPTAQHVQLPDTRPVAAAISIDDSRSMRTSDPTNQRAAAAKLFWSELFSANPANEVALLAFGAERPTAPFARTALLESWTSDAARLEAGVNGLIATGSTYLYHSTAEVAPWIASSRPAASYRHVLLLVTDGLPTDSGAADAAITAAAGAQIPIYTVGLGPASDHSPSSSAAAVDRLRTLANRTGGVYAGAENNTELTTTFESLAKLTTEGALLVTVRMNPAPAAGTVVAGTVRVANKFGGAAEPWSFTAP
jgi:hypothetical protein